jgi:hypothetical protein
MESTLILNGNPCLFLGLSSPMMAGCRLRHVSPFGWEQAIAQIERGHIDLFHLTISSTGWIATRISKNPILRGSIAGHWLF